MISDIQKKTIDAIISVFETGKIPSLTSYSTCTILKDGAGISYGKHQSTDRADSLDAIIIRYLDLGGAFGNDLTVFLDELSKDASANLDPSQPPQWAKDLMTLLIEAGKDPLMQQAQDQIFDEQYWVPAVKQAEAMKLSLPLSYAILYDTCIHSGPGGVSNIRKRFPESPPVKGGDEKKWAAAYIKARASWLLNSSNPIVRKTVYRMDAFQKIIEEGNWNLETPLTIRNIIIY